MADEDLAKYESNIKMESSELILEIKEEEPPPPHVEAGSCFFIIKQEYQQDESQTNSNQESVTDEQTEYLYSLEDGSVSNSIKQEVEEEIVGTQPQLSNVYLMTNGSLNNDDPSYVMGHPMESANTIASENNEESSCSPDEDDANSSPGSRAKRQKVHNYAEDSDDSDYEDTKTSSEEEPSEEYEESSSDEERTRKRPPKSKEESPPAMDICQRCPDPLLILTKPGKGKVGKKKCQECEASFFCDFHLKVHDDCHKFKFKCDVCETKFPSPGRLDVHYRYKHLPAEQRYLCRFCGINFQKDNLYNPHFEPCYGIAKKVVHKCSLCKIVVNSPRQFDSHTRYHHLEKEKRLFCRFCDGYYPDEQTYEKHWSECYTVRRNAIKSGQLVKY